MKESAINKTNIAIIFFTVLAAAILYIAMPDKVRPPLSNAYPEDDSAAFFDGATIKWIIPNNPGGGYDEYARLIAPYLGKYTGAHVHLSNIPGSGGMRALGELFKSPADGLTIAVINGSGMVTSQIAEISIPDYQIGELSFLGRIVDDTRVLTLSANSQYSSFTDIINSREPVKIGATGFGGSTYVDAVINRDLFSSNINVIHGFNNSAAVRHAMLRGQIDGSWSSLGSVMDEAASGQFTLVLQGGQTRVASLPDVPSVFEFAGETADPLFTQTVLSAWNTLHLVGRPVAAPPGIPPERLGFLREAFRQALHDPQFLNDALKARRPVKFASGEDMESIVKNALEMPANTQRAIVMSVKSEL